MIAAIEQHPELRHLVCFAWETLAHDEDLSASHFSFFVRIAIRFDLSPKKDYPLWEELDFLIELNMYSLGELPL